MKQNHLPRILVLTAIILAAALTRLIPHPPNFTPIGAMALFSGTCFADRRFAMLVPLLAMLVSDLFLGFHWLMGVVYFSFTINVLLGRWLRSRKTVFSIAAVTLIGSIQFFLITNFACWLLYYPHTLAGFTTCFVSAIPFFQNTLLGDAAYATALFGGMALVEKGVPAVRETRLATVS